jgi:probable phosphoglycerate mutase
VPRVLYVARHGETDWNAAQRWQGHTDVPLNETGRAQARALGEKLRARGIGRIVASDLARAHETASIVAVELGLAVAYVDAALRERFYGVFEGLTRAECESVHAEAWAAWVATRTVPQGAEDHGPFTARLVAAIGRAADAAPSNDPVLVVTHGGAMRALIATVSTPPPPLPNTAVWRLTWEGRLVGAEPFTPGE